MSLLSILGMVLIVGGVWMFFSKSDMQTSDDLRKTALLGFFGTALLRVFSRPKFTNVGKTSKKIHAVIFIIIGILAIYSSKFLN